MEMNVGFVEPCQKTAIGRLLPSGALLESGQNAIVTTIHHFDEWLQWGGGIELTLSVLLATVRSWPATEGR
jgi:hypothetical protein